MIIKDKNLGKFYIKYDGRNYTIYTSELSKEGKEYEKTWYYFSNLSAALQRIPRLQVEQEGKEYNLEQYIDAINAANQRIIKSLGNDK
jgi:hypothetical protein